MYCLPHTSVTQAAMATADQLDNIPSLFCALIVDVIVLSCSLIKKLFHLINDSWWHSLFRVLKVCHPGFSNLKTQVL